MRVIFLDFDGVLNSVANVIALHALRGPSTTVRCEVDRLDITALGLLKHLCDKTDAKIVVSSTWRRNYSLEEFPPIFAAYGWENAPFIGVTPRGGSGTVRGDEIASWLGNHPECTEYIIIDDDSDMLPSQLPRFVYVYGETGFDLKNLCQGLRLFGQPNNDFEANAYFHVD